MSDAKRKLYLAAQRDALFVAACDAMDEPTCDHHGPWGCKDAAAARPSPRGTGTGALPSVREREGDDVSAARPVNVADMIAWLRAHPDEFFFSLWSRDRLLIGTRSDTGEICAWDCNVQESKMEYDRRSSPAPETRTAETPARSLLRTLREVIHADPEVIAAAERACVEMERAPKKDGGQP